MQHSNNTNINNTYTYTGINRGCRRISHGQECGKKVTQSIQLKSALDRCDECAGLCSYIDQNGNTCQETIYRYSVFNNKMCDKHYEICEKIKKYKAWVDAKDFHEKYVFCGSHWEEADSQGVEDIYHYISKERLGDRPVEEIGKWDHDEEIWITNPIWYFCGPDGYQDILQEDYPEDYVERLLAEAMVNP